MPTNDFLSNKDDDAVKGEKKEGLEEDFGEVGFSDKTESKISTIIVHYKSAEDSAKVFLNQ